MEHIRIILYIVQLMIGAAAGLYVFLKRRTAPHTFLSPFFSFICFSNLIIFTSLAAEYTKTNIVGSRFYDFAVSFHELCAPFGEFFYVVMTYSLIRLVLDLQNRVISRRWKMLVWMGIPLIVANYASVKPEFFGENMQRIINATVLFADTAILVIILAFLISLLISSRKMVKPAERAVLSAFAWFYLLAFIIFASPMFFPYRHSMWVVAITLILFNLFPFIWVPQMIKTMPSIENMDAPEAGKIEQLLNTFGVSKREQEIARLIFAGKSNKEIQKELFISLNTVKNHIYSLYQKLGVNSRGQLINLILSSRTSHLDETG